MAARSPLRRSALALILVVIIAACSTGNSDDDAASEPAPEQDVSEPVDRAAGTGGNALPLREPPVEIEWRECGVVECGTLEVPLDHDDPDAATIELVLSRRRADGDAIGSLLVNPGGPGASGTFLVRVADDLFDSEVLDRFDIVAWDPRGVGESTAVDCLDDLDDFWAADRSPDSEDELEVLYATAQELVIGCQDRSADLLAHLSTSATIADMDLIREALGDERLSYVGFSYGTYLGSRYAEAYPDRVRALVLDGAVDPSLSFSEAALAQAAGFDGALGAFFDWCDLQPDCRLGVAGDAATDFDALVAAIDDDSIEGDDGRALGPGETDIGVASALYGGRDAWPTLARALELAATGDGSLLLSLADSYTGRTESGEYSNENEAFYATGCIDSPSPTTIGGLAEVADEVAEAAPRLGPAGVWLSLPCALWPVAPDERPRVITAPSTPPILVLGTTGDPATPPEWAEAVASQLESGVLVTLDDEGHVATGRGNRCIDGLVSAYLVDLVVPVDGTLC